MHYVPACVHPEEGQKAEEVFIWTGADYDPHTDLLAVTGCVWACPYSTIVLAALREWDLPKLAAEIAPDWDLPTEAVQSGLETLRSHLELVQGDIALLYEMT